MFTVVIPALNEEQGIAETILELQTVFAEQGYESPEIVVVDDGSSDGTGAEARRLGAKVVRHLSNLGYGKSLKDGILEASFDTIVTTDADGTYPAAELPKLLNKYNEGFDMVVGERTGDHYRESWFKMPLRRLLKFLVEFSSGTKVPDVNSGMRIFSRKISRKYFKQLSTSFSFSTSITLAYLMTSKCIAFVPIEYRERVGSSKVRLFRDSLRTLQFITQAILYYNPIKLFILFCSFILAIAIGAFLFGLLWSSVTLMLLGVGCVLMAILVFSLGLLADLLRQIMFR
ncbi:MAG: glycosyltransferase family 2 protein [Bdellovibrionales bacterium]|nr:glycosyltransferase family 2 protein [Bdellovibrionales bacterium]